MPKLASFTVPGLVPFMRKVVENEEKEKQKEAAAAGTK